MSQAHRQIKSNRYDRHCHVDDYGTTDFQEAMAQMHNRQGGHDRDANLLRLIAREGGDPARYAKAHRGPRTRGDKPPKADKGPCAVPQCAKTVMCRKVCAMHYDRYRKQWPGWREVAKYIAPPRGGKKRMSF